MSLSVSSRFALRSLLRHLRRTLLSVVGVGVGAAIGLITIAWISGEEGMIVRAAAHSGTGHLRIVPTGWADLRDPGQRLADWERDLRAARALEGIVVATPRARTEALLGFGTRIASVELTGVDPRTERRALRFVRNIAEGRYLTPTGTGEVVVGRTLAERLDAMLEDELVVTVVGRDGEMNSNILRIVGIVETGSREIDAQVCQVRMETVEELTGLSGAGEVTILIDDYRRIEEARSRLAAGIAAGDVIMSWDEVAPELLAGLQVDQSFADVTVVLVLFVVLLGVASAQLSGVLERRKELAVLAALGMRGTQMVRVVVAEALALGVSGTVLALAIATPVIHWLATSGVDLRDMAGDVDLAMSGVLIDPIFYADFGAWIVPYAIVLSMTATIVASIYPAWFATRTDPASALRVA